MQIGDSLAVRVVVEINAEFFKNCHRLCVDTSRLGHLASHLLQVVAESGDDCPALMLPSKMAVNHDAGTNVGRLVDVGREAGMPR
ncbi:hypothetical protein D3C85_1415990 [compost metagenome]